MSKIENGLIGAFGGKYSYRELGQAPSQTLEEVEKSALLLNFIDQHNLRGVVKNAASILHEQFGEGNILLGIEHDNDKVS